ncbi:MAG: hypothetical protein J4215_03185 [Candidatus Diapherotrites archaeon]|uniref:PIN domain-containing protein n=1 Tax=Candidatus Iainarchaeum sp. TaxID=3101447 RepID=A0A8T4LA09_9ARCH|nr:hypothetical protein [Candidatus Diapherotrites archaeon]
MYAYDTNLIIGLINPKDRLHQASFRYYRDQKEELFLLDSVLIETRTKFLQHYLDSLSEIIAFTNIHFCLPTIEELNKLSPQFENFHRLILSEIGKNETGIGVIDFETSIPMAKASLETKLSEIIGKINWVSLSDLTVEQLELWEKLKTAVFSDSEDREIFIECIAAMLQTDLNRFVTNDETFCKQAKRAIVAYHLDRFKFMRLEPIDHEPYYSVSEATPNPLT